MMLTDATQRTEFDDARLSVIASRAVSRRKNAVRRNETGHVATSERDYTREELEFHAAIREFQDRTGKKFPAWSEVLGVFKSLGYARP